MKKIGIITLTNTNNFGNRLQNYATQEVLKKYFNYEIETIKNYGPLNNRKINFIDYLKYMKLRLYEIFKEGSKTRKSKFDNFNKNIKFNNKTFKYKKEKYFNYEILVVGSDQIWHPIYRMKDFDLGDFGNCNFIFSLSSSLSIDKISNNYNFARIQKLLKNFKGITVREDKGKEIIKQITNRKDITVLIDPAMMLQKEEWNKVIKKPCYKLEKNYIVSFFLGNINNEINNYINELSRKHNCQVIDLIKDKEIYNNTGPSEFLYLEKNAKLILTDSFHAVVFAIIYNIPFIVFDRKTSKMGNMNSRIETLLNKFDLQDRLFPIRTENLFDLNFTNVNKILENERNSAHLYLNNMKNKYYSNID